MAQNVNSTAPNLLTVASNHATVRKDAAARKTFRLSSRTKTSQMD